MSDKKSEPETLSSALLRVTAFVLGVLTVLAVVAVYVFDLLPESAPEDAGNVLTVLAIFGVCVAIMSGSDS